MLDTSVIRKIDNDAPLVDRRVEASTPSFGCEGDVVACSPLNLSQGCQNPIPTLLSYIAHCNYSLLTLILCSRQ